MSSLEETRAGRALERAEIQIEAVQMEVLDRVAEIGDPAGPDPAWPDLVGPGR